MAATITRSTFPSAMRKGLDSCAIMGVEDQPTQYQDLCRVQRMGTKFVERVEHGRLSRLHEKAERTPIQFSDIEPGYLKRWTAVTYALGLRFSQEVREDDQYGLMMSYVRRLGQCTPRTMEYHAGLMYTAGDTVNYHTMPDGLALFADTHRLVPGGPPTFDNKMTASVLNATSLQSAIILARTAKDEHGQNIIQTPKELVVGPNLQFKASELLHSTHSPEDDRNAINAVRREYNIKARVWPEISNNDWFLLCEEHGMYLMIRTAPQTGESGDFLTGNALYMVRTRYVFGPWHVRGLVGVFV